MASFNRVVLIGNLCRDVELKYTQSGMAVTEIGLAVNDKRKNAAGEWVEEVTFVDVVLWARTAEVAAEYLHKGAQTLVEGRLKQENWTTQDGQKRSKLKVVADKLVLLGSKRDGGSSPPADDGYRPNAATPNPPVAQYDEPPRAAPAGEPEDGVPF